MENHPIEIDDAVMYALPSKEKALEIVNRLVNGVNDGSIAPLQLLVKLKFCEQIIDATLEQIRTACIDEASKYQKGEDIRMLGAELKVKEAGVKYDFSGCNDPIYTSYETIINTNKELLKSRSTLLKSIKTKTTIVDEETGETFELNPPSKKSTTVVEVRIKGMKDLFTTTERIEIEVI